MDTAPDEYVPAEAPIPEIPPYHIWLPEAFTAVNRAFWPPNRQVWFAFGGCLFWILLGWIWMFWMAFKITLWATVLSLLVVVQGLALCGEAIWRLTHRG